MQIFGALHERPDAIAGGFTVGQGGGRKSGGDAARQFTQPEAA